MKRRTFLQLWVLLNVGEDGGHREREAGGNRLKNDDHFQVRADLGCQLDREPEGSGAFAGGINRSQDRSNIFIVLNKALRDR